MEGENIYRLRFIKPSGARVYVHITNNLYQYLYAYGIVEQYVYNVVHHGKTGAPPPLSTIDDGFVWSRTPEGHTFWREHNDSHLNGEPLPTRNPNKFKEVI